MSQEVSVIIPVYNRSAVVSRSISSIKNLSPMSVKVIIVDDGSTDETVHVCRAELARLGLEGSVFEMGANKGPAAARNHGMMLAETEWLMFLDSDDELLPGAGESITKSLVAHAESTMHSFGYTVNGFSSPSYSGEGNAFRCFLRKKYFNTNTCVLKKDDVLDVSFKEDYRVGEDTDFWARLLFEKTHVHNDIAIARYNLEHKFGEVKIHPFYHITLPGLALSDGDKDEILSEYESYIFRRKASARTVSIKDIFLKRDMVAATLYFAGPRIYSFAWRLNRWVKK